MLDLKKMIPKGGYEMEEDLEEIKWPDFEGVDRSIAYRRAIDFMLRDWFTIRLNYYLEKDLSDFPVDEVEKELPMFRKHLKYYNQFVGQNTDIAFEAQLLRLEAKIEYLRLEDMYSSIYRNRK